MRICRRRLLRGLSGTRAEHLATPPAGRATGLKAPVQRTRQVLTAAHAYFLLQRTATSHCSARLLLTAAHTYFLLQRTPTSHCSAQLLLTAAHSYFSLQCTPTSYCSCTPTSHCSARLLLTAVHAYFSPRLHAHLLLQLHTYFSLQCTQLHAYCLLQRTPISYCGARLLLTAAPTSYCSAQLLLTAAHTYFLLQRTATVYCSARLLLTCGNNVTTTSDWNQPIMILSSVLSRWPVRPEKTLEQKPTSAGKCRRCELPNAYRCTRRVEMAPDGG